MKWLVQIFEVMITYGYLIGLVTFLVYILKAAIDFWFVTELEKKLMTDYQKLKGFASKLIITIIPSVFLTFLFTIIFEQDFFTKQENIDESLLLTIFLSIIFLLNISMNLIITVIEKALNLKSDYILFINDEEWNIKRLTKNNLLLLINKENEYLLIDEWKDKKIKKVVNKHNYTYKIYSKNSNWIKFIAVNTSIIIMSAFAFTFFYDTIYSSLLLFTGCLAFLSALIILGNLVEYKRNYTIRN